MNRQISVAIGASLIVLGFAASGVGGYILGKKRAAQQFEEQLTTEIEEAKNYYQVLYNKAGYSTPEEAVKNLIGEKEPERLATVELVRKVKREAKDRTDYNAISTQYQGDQTPPTPVMGNIWDKKQALPPRGANGQFVKQTPGETPNEDPYIIDEETFLQNDTEYDQEEVTYHWRDNTMIDAQGDSVENEIFGEVNLSLLRSDVENNPDDSHVIYIRNEKLTMEYCVVVSDESVAATLGLDQED